MAWGVIESLCVHMSPRDGMGFVPTSDFVSELSIGDPGHGRVIQPC